MYIVPFPPPQGKIDGEENTRLGEENPRLTGKKLKGKERKKGKRKKKRRKKKRRKKKKKTLFFHFIRSIL